MGLEIFAVFTVVASHGASWAWQMLYGALGVSVLVKIFFPEVKAWTAGLGGLPRLFTLDVSNAVLALGCGILAAIFLRSIVLLPAVAMACLALGFAMIFYKDLAPKAGAMLVKITQPLNRFQAFADFAG